MSVYAGMENASAKSMSSMNESACLYIQTLWTRVAYLYESDI